MHIQVFSFLSHLSINLSLNPFYVGWSEHITTDLGSIFQHTRQQSSSKLRVWRYVFLIIWQLRSLANIVYWTMDSRISSGSSACPGPGKLPMFGVRENPKIRPQFRMILNLHIWTRLTTWFPKKKERQLFTFLQFSHLNCKADINFIEKPAAARWSIINEVGGGLKSARKRTEFQNLGPQIRKRGT